MRVGFIGFGGAGYGLSKGLRGAGLQDQFFFDTRWGTPAQGAAMRQQAAETGALALESLEELLLRAEILISCVTGAAAVTVAQQAAVFLRPDHLYVDVNTAAPETKVQVAAVVEQSGAAFVDAALMGAVPAFLHRVPILASGEGAARFKAAMQAFEMDITCVGQNPGQASAIKLFRSIFMKGLLALLLETLDATRRYGVDDIVLGSIAESLDRHPFRETARIQVTKGVVNAERMAHEMEAVIRTLEGLKVSAIMSRATREKLNWCQALGLKNHFKGELPASLEAVLGVLPGASG